MDERPPGPLPDIGRPERLPPCLPKDDLLGELFDGYPGLRYLDRSDGCCDGGAPPGLPPNPGFIPGRRPGLTRAGLLVASAARRALFCAELEPSSASSGTSVGASIITPSAPTWPVGSGIHR